ncbi:MAG: aminopeptidase N [Xanthomonadales bacterium]|nr:aminopeptidase N [Xanthomonadales bacterium]
MHNPEPIRLADYLPPAWTIRHANLVFDLDRERTLVRATLDLEPQRAGEMLRLDGEDLELLHIAVDGRELAADEYRYTDGVLELPGVHEACQLHTEVAIAPRRNTRLEGLYCSGPMLLTQCEAEGFRRITFFVDRPDVSASFEVTLRADRTRYPVLLCNGNPAGNEDLDDGRHLARWHDPHPKPCYLFALVAGDIERVRAPFETADGRAVDVSVWAERADVPRCGFALASTLRAMRWDEQRFGRCYDLDVFNIVAAQDFTMGAMENKGLNIFNARYILADADTATDADYEAIESVIGHEYFHNWSGNRVTLRDWFQLSLKEGLTVFRDQEFTSDLRSRGVKRIADVRGLRARQFVEDAGPLAHPVRPHAYREINNFYTMTVYEKGAELIRMLHSLIGETAFRRGLDGYFARHDGGAATIEDLIACLGAAAGRDLSPYLAWYDQAGTPELHVADEFDAQTGRYGIEVTQRTPPTPDQADKQALPMPFRVRLYDRDGHALNVQWQGGAAQRGDVIEIDQARQRLEAEGLTARPLPTFLHGLSAPVRLHFDYGADDLVRLLRCESDPVIRWDAMQRLAVDAIVHADAEATEAWVDAFGGLLEVEAEDPALIAECLALPDLGTLADAATPFDVDVLFRRREDLLELAAETHVDRLDARYQQLSAATTASLDPPAAAARRLRNLTLGLLSRLDPAANLAQAQFANAQTLTDRLAALALLVHLDAPDAAAALSDFRRRWRHDPLMTDKWIGIVASRPHPQAVDAVQALIADPEVWQPANPNRVRAVLGTLARSNPVALHRPDGAGHALCLEHIVALDRINPQVAARLLGAFEVWPRLDATRRDALRHRLQAAGDAITSRDARDVLQRLLEAG